MGQRDLINTWFEGIIGITKWQEEVSQNAVQKVLIVKTVSPQEDKSKSRAGRRNKKVVTELIMPIDHIW